MSKLVEFEAVIKFFDDWASVLEEQCHHQSASDLKIIKKDFINLPSVNPEQMGRWMNVSGFLSAMPYRAGWMCSKCGGKQETRTPYCPMCGDKKEGGAD